ncbi:hypothetical protein V6N13_044255 [Hibiscus sabdariffa]
MIVASVPLVSINPKDVFVFTDNHDSLITRKLSFWSLETMNMELDKEFDALPFGVDYGKLEKASFTMLNAILSTEHELLLLSKSDRVVAIGSNMFN